MINQTDEEESTKINFASAAFKKYFFNTSWLFFERVVRLIIIFFVGIYIVRYLGPEDFGLLSYAISFVGLFSSIAALGLDNIIVRELVKEPEKKNKLLGTVFSLRLTGAIVSIILIALVLYIIKEDTFNSVLILIIATLTLFQSFNVIDFYFQATVTVKNSVAAQFISLLISSVIKILLIVYSAPLIYFAIVTSAEFFLLSVGFNFIYKLKGNSIFNWKYDSSLAKSLLKDSWPLILSGIAIAVYMKIDQVMIKKMLTTAEVGYYAGAVRICEAWYFIPVAIVTSLFPAIINAKNKSENLYNSRLQKLYDLLAFIAIAIAIPVTLFNETIISILLGGDYLPSASVLTIYIWAGLAVSLGVATNQYLITENYTRFSFYRTFAGMILNVILNFILIPIWGIEGSAVATLISYSIVAFSVGATPKTYHQSKMILKAIFLVNIIKAAAAKLKIS